MSGGRDEMSGVMPDEREEREALIAAYALGGATTAEGAEARRIIAGDPDAARLYAELAAIAAVLPEALADPDAVPVAPSAGLKERILASARAEMHAPADTPSTPIPLAGGRARRRGGLHTGWLVAAVFLVAVLGLGAWNVTLQRDLARANTDREVLRLAAAGVHAYTMAGTRNAPTANATLIESSADGGRVLLFATGFPGVAAGQTYRIWLQKQDGSYVDAGTFQGGGDATTLVLPGNLNGVHAVIITAEPQAKPAASPTGPPVMEGALTA